MIGIGEKHKAPGTIAYYNTKKITELGKQMEPFIWGKAELRDFYSADGKPLKGILVKPENFDPKKKYPLMVYIYETLHQGLGEKGREKREVRHDYN